MLGRQIAVALAVGAALAVAVATSFGAGPGSTWKVTFAGPNGGDHVYNVTADSPNDAVDAAFAAFRAQSTVKSVQDTTPPPTTSTSTSTTSTTTSTTSTTTTPPPTGGYPSLAPPFRFNGDFEPSGALLTSGGWSVNEAGSDHPGTAATGPSTSGQGSYQGKYTTPAGSGTGRAELQMPQLATPVTVDYEQLFYVPSKANGGPDHGYLSQTKQGSNPCSNGGLTLNKATASLAWSIVGSCSAGSNKHDLGLGASFRDHWFAIRVTSTFSNTGHAKVQYDPDGTGPAGYVTKLDVAADTLSGSGLKLRQGIYHDQDPYLTTVYGDGFHAK